MHSFKQYTFLVAVACLATFASAIPVLLLEDINSPTVNQQQNIDAPDFGFGGVFTRDIIQGIGLIGNGNSNEDSSNSANVISGGDQQLSGLNILNNLPSSENAITARQIDPAGDHQASPGLAGVLGGISFQRREGGAMRRSVKRGESAQLKSAAPPW